MPSKRYSEELAVELKVGFSKLNKRGKISAIREINAPTASEPLKEACMKIVKAIYQINGVEYCGFGKKQGV